MVQRILRVTQNTYFKRRPEQSSELETADLYGVPAGETFEIQSYAYADASGDFNQHIKFALKNQSINGFNTWFIYSRHAQVEFDGVVVYPQEDQNSLPILRVTQDTVLKRRPLQSSVLSPDELYSISKGQSILLQSYAYADSRGDFSSHIRFTIRNESDYIRGFNTWYIYDQHAYVEFDGEIVYPREDPDVFILRILQNTLFKRRPLSSPELGDDEKYAVSRGNTFKLQSYAYADASGTFNNHIKFALKYERDYINYLSTWYVYNQYAQVEQHGKVVYPPTPKPPAPPTYSGIPFKLPGNNSTFYTDQPIIPGGNFSWGEATRNATRIPETKEIVDNIIALAEQLEKVRAQLGRPLIINSWYRPPLINNAVGGATRSQHLFGKAADLQAEGLSGRRIANAVMPWWPGGIGIYSNLPNIVHLDIGSRRFWGF